MAVVPCHRWDLAVALGQGPAFVSKRLEPFLDTNYAPATASGMRSSSFTTRPKQLVGQQALHDLAVGKHEAIGFGLQDGPYLDALPRWPADSSPLHVLLDRLS